MHKSAALCADLICDSFEVVIRERAGDLIGPGLLLPPLFIHAEDEEP